MIALDTSALSAYLAGGSGEDIELVEEALQRGHAVLPPVVLAELLSTPRLKPHVADVLRQLPLLPILDGYWERVGVLRATILEHKLKARLADSLIAQSCLDHRVALISRDIDFRHFVKHGGLKLLP